MAESKISGLETEIKKIEQEMTTPEGASDTSLYEKHDSLKKDLARLMDEWTELTLELDSLTT